MTYVAILTCTDDECAERFVARGSLAELEALCCDCGCCLQIVGWAEPADEVEEPVQLLAA